MVESHASTANCARNRARLINVTCQNVALQTLHSSVRQHAELVSSVTEMQAPIGDVNVLQRDPARYPSILKGTAPVTFVLMPPRGDAFGGRLCQELVVLERDSKAQQGAAELSRPRPVDRVVQLGPQLEWVRLDYAK